MPAPPVASLRALHRYTWWSLVAFAAMTVAFPLLLSAPELARTPPARILGLVIGATLVAGVHLALVRGALTEPRTRPGRALVAVTVAAGVLALVLPWLAGRQVVAWSIPAAGLLSAALMHAPERRRRVLTGAGGLLVVVDTAVAGAVAGLPTLPTVVGVVLAVAAVLFSLLGSLWIWLTAVRLDQARHTEADLAVAKERLRFAADLHDLQGHHLQVIALKGSLVARLIGTDDGTARREAEEVATIARTALAETREVVAGYRQTGFATELGNAVEVLRAAGIDTTVEGEPTAVPPAAAPLFGALVREGTTNVLRHSRATRAVVAVAADRLSLVNDAPSPQRPPGATGDGTGIAGLRERFGAAGGEIEVAHREDRFELRGTLR